MTNLNSELKLPCGITLPHRIAKSAMTEGLADELNQATASHVSLYRRWAEGGAALLLTGNVQIDPDHLERPGNILIHGEQSEQQLNRLRAMSQASKNGKNHIWMQLSHAGRQTPSMVNKTPFAPSAVALNMPKGQFGPPQPLSEEQILEIIKGFAHAAKIAKETGFTGVQVHAAHGYLISSFLTPLVNRRQDKWGGSLEKRARLLREVIAAIRAAVGDEFPIAVKLNSADYQDHGFSQEDSLQVALWLEEDGVDLIEISGGNYESAAMMGAGQRSSTKKREAYFLEYASNIRQVVSIPLMVTGGFRSVDGMKAALASGDVDVVGMARPLCTDTDLPRRLLAGEIDAAPRWEKHLRLGSGIFSPQSSVGLLRLANAWGMQGWFCMQLIRMGQDKDPDRAMSVLAAIVRYFANEARTASAMKKARKKAAA